MGGVSIISGTLFRVRQEPFLTSKIIMLVIIIFTFYKKKYYLISSLSGLFFLFSVLFFSHVTVHSVHSNVAKIHSRLPAAMEFWLVCLGILAYSCQNTSRDSGVWTVTTLITIILIISKTIAIVNAFWYNQLYRYCYSVLSNITSAWMLLQIQNRNFLT